MLLEWDSKAKIKCFFKDILGDLLEKQKVSHIGGR